LIESEILKETLLADLLAEVNELTAILITCAKNVKNSKKDP